MEGETDSVIEIVEDTPFESDPYEADKIYNLKIKPGPLFVTEELTKKLETLTNPTGANKESAKQAVKYLRSLEPIHSPDPEGQTIDYDVQFRSHIGHVYVY